MSNKIRWVWEMEIKGSMKIMIKTLTKITCLNSKTMDSQYNSSVEYLVL